MVLGPATQVPSQTLPETRVHANTYVHTGMRQESSKGLQAKSDSISRVAGNLEEFQGRQ